MKKIIISILLIGFFFGTRAQKTFTEPLMILPGNSSDMDALDIANKTKYIATGSWDKLINVYSADSPYKLVAGFPGLAPATAVKFSRDGKLLAGATSDFNIRIWDSAFKVIKSLDGHKDNINTMLFDGSRKYLFSGSDDRTIIIWDIPAGKILRTISNNQPVNSMAQTSDPRYLIVAGGDPKIKIYSLVGGTVTKTLDGHTDMVNSIAVSPNSQYLVSGSNDKTARIWDLKTGKEVKKLPVDCWKITAVAFSSDSRYVLTGCNTGLVKVWDAETGNLIATMGKEGENVREVAFSPDMKKVLIASMLRGSTDYGIRIWPSGINFEVPVAKTETDSLMGKPTIHPADSLKKKTPPANKPLTPAQKK